MTKEEEITKLTEIWYSIVSLDLHKDSDCHWYINKIWSYGQKSYYQIEHYGYIYELDKEDKNMQYPTYEHAEKRLREIIEDAIEEEKEWAVSVLRNTANFDRSQIKKAQEIMELTDFLI